MAYNSGGFGWDEIWVSFTTDVDTNNTWPSGDITFWNGTLSEQPSWLQIDLDNNFTVAEGSTYAFTLNSPSMCGAGTMISLNQDYSDGAITYTDKLSSDLANKLKRLENPVLDFDNAKKENGHTEFLKKYFL